MLTLFECRIRYNKPDEETGKEKRVTEAYLFDALTYTEAEARVADKMPEYISGEWALVSIRKAQYSEIIPSEGDRWFKCRVTFITIDERSGKEKRTAQNVLVMADDIKGAVDAVVKGMNGTTADFEVTGVTESNIMEYFPLFDKEEPAIQNPTE